LEDKYPGQLKGLKLWKKGAPNGETVQVKAWKRKFVLLNGKIHFGSDCDTAGAKIEDLWSIPKNGTLEFDVVSGRMTCLYSKIHSFDLKNKSDRNTVSDLRKLRRAGTLLCENLWTKIGADLVGPIAHKGKVDLNFIVTVASGSTAGSGLRKVTRSFDLSKHERHSAALALHSEMINNFNSSDLGTWYGTELDPPPARQNRKLVRPSTVMDPVWRLPSSKTTLTLSFNCIEVVPQVEDPEGRQRQGQLPPLRQGLGQSASVPASLGDRG
jgi:hypothetical protein